ncbi:MAG: YbaB/EbfC family nucleoid-associated protein [Mycoplasma sp.]|nr:YbaB/EbfC family nucleoid-associated protein [Mycoplasma sp.]
MNFNNLMQQAKMMQKKLDEFSKKEFEYDYSNGSVIVKLTGDLKIISLTINKTLIDPEDPITLQEMVAEAINSAIALVNEQKEEIAPSGSGMF